MYFDPLKSPYENFKMSKLKASDYPPNTTLVIFIIKIILV
jgi:hypothetical protein